MGIRYKRKRHKKDKSIPKVIEFVVKNRKEIRDAVKRCCRHIEECEKCY